jgi:two-component system, LytTR family, sensor kinase
MSTNNYLKATGAWAALRLPALNHIPHLRLYLGIGLSYLLMNWLVDITAHPGEAVPRTLNACWRVLYLIGVNYLFFEKMMPRMGGRRLLRSLLYAVALFFLYSFVAYGWRSIGVFLYVYTEYGTFERLRDAVCDNMPYGVVSFFWFGIIRHVYGHLALRQQAQQLKIEKQEAELNYLKAQTNPHFLFNTLNNIYVLAKDKSDQAPESILRLSGILRFMLYKAGKPTIPVGQEVQIIRDYLALEKLRYAPEPQVDFSYEIRDMQQAIPPLLLMPLVENAFKHGVAHTRERPFVSIFLSINAQRLFFQVKNSTDTLHAGASIHENIGIGNLRRQLELLYTAYALQLEPSPGTFTATLEIQLDRRHA